MDPTNVDMYWPDNAPTGIVCGDQPDGDGECTNEVLKGCSGQEQHIASRTRAMDIVTELLAA